MCGIFGYLHSKQIPALHINLDLILSHRGPDDQGWLLYDNHTVLRGQAELPDFKAKLLLLHKRLAIHDLSSLGQQPMACENNRYYLLFNGEIYNYLELRQLLVQQGVTFISNTDSEVLLQSYIHWGKACLKKLTGMFALVIFDRLQKKLFIARDGFGIKPLYYYCYDEQLLFASEIKTLLPYLPKPKINSQQLFYYLRSGMTDYSDKTFFKNIKQVLPGHYIEIDIENFSHLQQIQYWQPESRINSDITFIQAAQQVREHFLKNIELHLRGEVNWAATLSGGIDSSAIVSSIRHLYPQRSITTFSYIAAQKNINEEHWIDIVNAATDSRNHKVYANLDQVSQDLDHLIQLQDEPFGSTSIYAQQRIFAAAAQQDIKIMLDGQGADEVLGGYNFYTAARIVSLIKQGRLMAAMQLLHHSRNYLGNSVFFHSLVYLLPSTWQERLRSMTAMSYVPNWLNRHWFERQQINFLPLKKSYGHNVLHEELLHTCQVSSLPMLLRYEDRNSMAHSIESRVPFLTTAFVDFIFSLPEKFIISQQGLTKAVFRAAMQGIVPPAILNRRDKIGFATPEQNWLKTIKPWVETTLTSSYAKNLPFLNHDIVMQHWQLFLSDKIKFDNRFWRWLNIIKWAQLHHIDFELN